MDPVTGALILGGLDFASGFFNQPDTTAYGSKTTLPEKTDIESMLEGLGIDQIKALVAELENLPEGLSLESLSSDPFVQLFGPEGLSSLLGGSPTAQDQALVDQVFGAASAQARRDFGAGFSEAERRATRATEDATRDIKASLGAQGIRGTTAGSGASARAIQDLTAGLQELSTRGAVGFENLATEGMRGRAAALLDLPFQRGALGAQMAALALQERSGRERTRTLSEQARNQVLSNPILSKFFQERLATATTTPFAVGGGEGSSGTGPSVTNRLKDPFGGLFGGGEKGLLKSETLNAANYA